MAVTKTQAQTWPIEANIGVLRDRWTAKATATEDQVRALDRAHAAAEDYWKGAAGRAFGDYLLRMRTELAAISTAFHNAAAVARRQTSAMTGAQQSTVAIIAEAENKQYTVAENGAVLVPHHMWAQVLENGGTVAQALVAKSAFEGDARLLQARIVAGLTTLSDLDRDTATALTGAAENLPDRAPDSRPHPIAPAAPPVPNNTDAQENRRYWDSLTPDQQDNLIATSPASVGSLDGLPADARDRANRTLLPLERARLESEVATLQSQLSSAAAKKSNIGGAQRLAETQQRLADLRAVEKEIVGHPEHKLLLLDMKNGAQGRAAIAHGDPDTADHLSVTTPGFTTNLHDSLADKVKETRHLQDEVERQLERDPFTAKQSVATVFWLGYDPPQLDVNATGVAFDDHAKSGARDLNRFYDGLGVAHNGTDPHITALGHSYGSLTTGLALQESGRHPVDDMVVYGSPGLGGTPDLSRVGSVPGLGWAGAGIGLGQWTGLIPYGNVHSTQDLGLAPGHAYEMTAKNDIVANLNGFGPSPQAIPGFTHLNTGAATIDGRHYSESTGHSQYADTERTSGFNLAAIVAGFADQAKIR